jgi:hypothetical protein
MCSFSWAQEGHLRAFQKRKFQGTNYCYIPSADGSGCLHFFDEMFGGVM